MSAPSSRVHPGPGPVRSALLRAQEYLHIAPASLCSDISPMALQRPPGLAPLLVFPNAQLGEAGPSPAHPLPGPPGTKHLRPGSQPPPASSSAFPFLLPGLSDSGLAGPTSRLCCCPPPAVASPPPPHPPPRANSSSFKIQLRCHLTGDAFPRRPPSGWIEGLSKLPEPQSFLSCNVRCPQYSAS